MSAEPVFIATRGSPLALVQARFIAGKCQALMPERRFELKIIRTTGDKLQTANLANPNQQLTKGLFTKELEVALLNRESTLAVHSLKDLPTELPDGLTLGASTEREDPRDVLIYPGNLRSGGPFDGFEPGAILATSSTRRAAQILAVRPDLKTLPVRGNVGTRLNKLATRGEFHGMILALAGLKRLGFTVSANGELAGPEVPANLAATILPVEMMLPCPGQAALGVEIRADDSLARELCAGLNHQDTLACVRAERAFLAGMGGGCLSPVAALAELRGTALRLRAVSFQDGTVRRGEQSGPIEAPEALGRDLARTIKL